MLLDAMGRTVRTTARLAINDLVEMQYEYDIRGNVLSITDALGRIVFRNGYDLANQVLYVNHLDAGEKYSVMDAAGKPIYMYDTGKGSAVYNNYDAISRPLKSYARDYTAESFTLRSYVVYGDHTTQGPADPADTNHLGKPYKSYDESGLVTILEYDFKGNPLSKVQRVVSDDTLMDVINAGSLSSWEITPYRTDWTETPWDEEVDLLEGNYQTDMQYDALNRAVQVTLPEDVNTDRKVLMPTYNRAGVLEKVVFDSDTYVEKIAYNAKGQRLMIAYGNTLMTRYTYDNETFRLLRQRTESFTQSGEEYTSAGSLKEDRTHLYDLSGNILSIHEYGTDVGVSSNPDELLRTFKYDPLYRLLEATGRECNTTISHPWEEDSSPCSTMASSTAYRRHYQYDKMGNMTKMRHVGATNTTRNYAYGPGNRMNELVIGANTYGYDYDANGNLKQEYSNRFFEYDQSDRLRAFYNQTGSSEPTIYEQYVYGPGGRVKKFTRKSSTSYDVTTYIDGVFEYHKRVTVGGTEEKNYTHIMDDTRRIAMVRTGNWDDDLDGMSAPIVPYIQYHLEDHLQSCSLRCKDDGATIDREEYFPYGESSLTNFAKKRYRYTGKEKDEHSGLYYYGARYYAPWLARFTSVDPASLKTHYQSSYNYADCNPVMMNDPTGMQPDSTNSSKPSGGGNEENISDGNQHIVKEGETLYSIAKNTNTTVEKLMELNNIEDPTKLQIGTKLDLGQPTVPVDSTSEGVTPTGIIMKKANQGNTLSWYNKLRFRYIQIYYGIKPLEKRDAEIVAGFFLKDTVTPLMNKLRGTFVYRGSMWFGPALPGTAQYQQEREQNNDVGFRPEYGQLDDHTELLALAKSGKSAYGNPMSISSSITAFSKFKQTLYFVQYFKKLLGFFSQGENLTKLYTHISEKFDLKITDAGNGKQIITGPNLKLMFESFYSPSANKDPNRIYGYYKTEGVEQIVSYPRK